MFCSCGEFADMPMLTKFDRTNLAAIRERLNMQFASVEEEFGIKFKLGTMRFGEKTLSAKLEAYIVQTTETGNSIPGEQIEFNRLCALFGLEPNDFGKPFSSQGKIYTIYGLAPRSRKFPLLGKSTTGKIYKFSLDTLGRYFASKQTTKA